VGDGDGGSSTGLWLYDSTHGRILPVAAVGALLGVAFLVAWVAGVAFLGDAGTGSLEQMPGFGAGSWAEVIVRALVLGYTVTMPAIGIRLAAQQLELVRPHLGSSEEASHAAQSVLRVPPWWRWLGSAAGVAILLIFGDMAIAFSGESPALTPLWFALFGALLGRALAAHLHIGRAFSQLGRHFVPIDLLDRRPFAPLVSWGLRIFLAWVVWFGLTSLFFVDPGPRDPNWSNLLGIVPLALIGVGALLVPVWGIHARLREAKEGELARLDEAVRRERDSLWRDGASSSPELANLAGYRMLVADQSDWPLDVSTWLRFGFYLALGAGSWIGAALVEQIRGRALG